MKGRPMPNSHGAYILLQEAERNKETKSPSKSEGDKVGRAEHGRAEEDGGGPNHIHPSESEEGA